MIDLIFMEKIARWLTNTQVKIKAEVANSNSQAQQLAQHLSNLDRRVDACERPNLDKEVNTFGMQNFFLNTVVFHSFLCIYTHMHSLLTFFCIFMMSFEHIFCLFIMIIHILTTSKNLSIIYFWHTPINESNDLTR